MKIAIYAICKNEINFVDQFLQTTKDADHVVVLDTGSTDGTDERLKSAGITVHYMNKDIPFRFDYARNLALSFVPDDADMCVSIDFDEAFFPDWRQKVEKLEVPFASYTWVGATDAEGNVTLSLPRAAIHKRHGYTWKYPVHEVLTADDGSNVVDSGTAVVHYGAPKEAGHYLKLLHVKLDENPNDPRAYTYLAREYFAMGNLPMAQTFYKKALQLEKYPPFRMEICLRLALSESHYATACWWYNQAIQECNIMREPYCQYASFLFSHKQYEKALALILDAQTLPKPDLQTTFDDVYYTMTYIDHMLLALYTNLDWLGRVQPLIAKLSVARPMSQELVRDLEIARNAITKSVFNFFSLNVKVDHSNVDSPSPDLSEAEPQGVPETP